MILHKSFYFIRHGETEWNRLGLYMGSQDIPLNKTGITQAKAASFLLKKEPIDHIITSPLIRALQTAEIIAKTINKPITIVENLKERYLGTKEGKRVNKTISMEQLVINTNNNEEEADAFQNRVTFSMNHILANFIGNALIVSHGGVYGTMCEAMKWPIIELKNCMPIYRTPPGKDKHSWLIHNLKD